LKRKVFTPSLQHKGINTIFEKEQKEKQTYLAYNTMKKFSTKPKGKLIQKSIDVNLIPEHKRDMVDVQKIVKFYQQKENHKPFKI
jgi:hypothetical protein